MISGGLSSGDIVGVVFGVIIGLALIAAGGIFGYIYVLKPRLEARGPSATTKDTTAFAFSNTTYSDTQDADAWFKRNLVKIKETKHFQFCTAHLIVNTC